MIVENAKDKPLGVAVRQTFDGAHPCSLCHAVSKGTQSQKKSDTQATTPKVDLICSIRTTSLMADSAPFHYPPLSFSLVEHAESPPVPPPRELVA